MIILILCVTPWRDVAAFPTRFVETNAGIPTQEHDRTTKNPTCRRAVFLVGEGQTEENHSEKGECRIGGGSLACFLDCGPWRVIDSRR